MRLRFQAGVEPFCDGPEFCHQCDDVTDVERQSLTLHTWYYGQHYVDTGVCHRVSRQ